MCGATESRVSAALHGARSTSFLHIARMTDDAIVQKSQMAVVVMSCSHLAHMPE
jgi:hypothetical protein